MRKLLLFVPVLAALLLACESKPPVGPGVVKITETTTSTSTSTTTTSTIAVPTVSLFQFTPQTPQVLQTVNFDGSLSTPGSNRTIVRYAWDFGDGESKTGIRTTHDYTISVNDHTDDVGTAAYNQALSERRAQAVRDYLVKAGLPPGIMSVEGHGKSLPLVKGTTDAARAKNRRVELGLVNTQIRYGR